MRAIIAFVFLVFITGHNVWTQTLIKDYLVNDPNLNTKGVGRTAIAATANGNFAVAWQDFNDYNDPVLEQPRVAVRMFSPTGAPIGPLNLFKGESRPLALWTSDFLESNPDLAFLPDGTLLVAVEHKGRFSILVDDVGSSEVGVGALTAEGIKLDASGPNINGEILWLNPIRMEFEENPRVAAAPTGVFFVLLNGSTFDTGRSAVSIQQFDSAGNFVGDFFTPHPTDPSPQFNHLFPDMATNGNLHVVVWQDGRRDSSFDISAQFYNNNGPLGNNLKVNRGDPQGTLNLLPSVAMNANGKSVVVWADTRNNSNGEVFGQLFNSAGQAVGGNFQISSGEGEISDRPEVALLNDDDFMVVWTDSAAGVEGDAAFRARGRQFDRTGQPLGPTLVLPNQDISSGLANIATDGVNYYCSWLDVRLGTDYANVYARRFPPRIVLSN